MNIVFIRDNSIISDRFSEILDKNDFKVSYVELENVENQRKMLTKLELADIIINVSYGCILETQTSYSKIYLEKFKSLISIIKQLKKRPDMFITTSFTSIYSDNGIQNEMDISYGNNYLSNLAVSIEEEASSLQEYNVRPIIMRLPLVIDSYKFIKNINRIYRFKTKIKNIQAQNFLTWVSCNDISRALMFIIKDNTMSGVFNIASPRITRNQEMIDILRHKFGKSFFTLPNFIAKVLLKNYIYLFDSLKVQPKRLLDKGFVFKDKVLNEFIKNI